MRLGDSLTVGYATLDGGAFASKLPVDAQLVGSVGSKHEGHGGYRISQIASGIDGWLASAMPTDVVLVIGTNDAFFSTVASDAVVRSDVNAALAQLRTLVLKIASKIAGWVIVGTIPPLASTWAKWMPWVITYNEGVIAMVDAFAREGYRVALGDVDKATSTSDLSGDGVHLSAAGYAKMGAQLGQSLRNAWAGKPNVSTGSSSTGAVVVTLGLLYLAWKAFRTKGAFSL